MKIVFDFDSGEFIPKTGGFARPRHEIPCTSSMTVKLPYAHYTDHRFDKEQLVFDSGEPVEKSDYTAYDDLLRKRDYAAYNKGFKDAADLKHQPLTAAFFQAVLASYHQAPVKLKKVWTGCDLSSGYQYWAFAYSVAETEEKLAKPAQ